MPIQSSRPIDLTWLEVFSVSPVQLSLFHIFKALFYKRFYGHFTVESQKGKHFESELAFSCQPIMYQGKS